MAGTPVIAAMLSGLVPRDLVLRCHLYLWYYFLLFYTLASCYTLHLLTRIELFQVDAPQLVDPRAGGGGLEG